ncbi:MAG: InlB B-repeat-containing protein [Elusimicrobiota bacterium]|nr:InlB B-repeat-containing protein [Endomicrobiia bacterium]MDW8166565.1 InlB B-repeat-containing protein [Elusimicrobiota bacterium]
MKKQNLLFILLIFLFACPQQQNKSSSTTSTQTQVYTLSVSISPLGSGSILVNPESPGRKYIAGTAVTLEAIPNSGWKFSYWSGDVSRSTSSIIVIVMNSNKTIIANFSQITSTYTPTYTLTVNVSPPSAGYVTKTPDLSSYSYGTNVTLQAISATGYVFVNWTGDVPSSLQSQNPLTISMTSNKQITANFQQIPQGGENFTLEILVDPADGGYVTKTPNRLYYASGENVTIEAVPNEGFAFEGWSGNLTGNQNPTTITITGNLRITANFSRSRYILNITIYPPNTGIVNKNPNYSWYYPNTEVELQAVPLGGYRFVGWSGDVESSTSPIRIIMNSDKNIIATFEKKPSEEMYMVTIGYQPSSASSLWVSKTPDKPLYAYGEEVTLTAEPESGWRFVRWSIDNVTSTQNPITITVTKNVQVIAYFEQY